MNEGSLFRSIHGEKYLMLSLGLSFDDGGFGLADRFRPDSSSG